MKLLSNFCIFSSCRKKGTSKNRKKATRLRKPLSARELLAITLGFLTTQETYGSFWYQYQLSPSSISSFVPEFFITTIEVLAGEYMRFRSNEWEWHKIGREYEGRR